MAISGTSTFPLSAARNWRAPVANAAALPSAGNFRGDVIVTLDTNAINIWNGSAWVTPASGSVTSVAASVPAALLTISGSPITTSGTLAFALATQSANTVFSGPTSGGAATPTFRSLVGADLPNPGASSLGGIQSFAAASNQFIRQISTSGVVSAGQPSFSNLSGTLASTQMVALTGDVSNTVGTSSIIIGAIQGATVAGTTGSLNVVFSDSPTFSTATTFTGQTNTFSGTATSVLNLSGAGGGITMNESGTKARLGNSTLTAGTVTVSNTTVSAKTRIFLQAAATGGVQGVLSYTISAATSFTINSSNVADTSTVNWFMVEHS